MISSKINIESEKRFADTDLYDAMSDGIVIYSPTENNIIYSNPSYLLFDSTQQKNRADDALINFMTEKISQDDYLKISGFSKIKIKTVSKVNEPGLILVVLIRQQHKPFTGHYEVLKSAEARLNIGTWQYLVADDKLSISEGLAKILGFEQSSLASNYPQTLSDFLTFISPEDIEQTIEVFDKIIQTGEFEKDIEMTIVVKGEVKFMSARILKVVSSENGTAVLQGVMADISKEKSEEVIKLKSFAELNKSNAALTEFAYTASHDLQEPLRKIEAYANRLENTLGEEISEKAKGYLTRLKAASVRMSGLINDILKLSRLNAKVSQDELVDLNEVVLGILGDYEERISTLNAQITYNLPSLNGSGVQLQQLFQNLIGNGLKFVKEDVTPIIKLSTETISKDKIKNLGLDKTKKYYEIKVKDNGIGFDQQFAENIFTPFKRLFGRSEFPGTGIGLAICKKVIENHDGLIKVESVEDVGSTFLIYLPQ